MTTVSLPRTAAVAAGKNTENPKRSHLDLLGLRSVPTIQSSAGLERRLATPDWAAYLTYIGWWIAGALSGSGVTYCVLSLPTRACASPLVAFGALLRSAMSPCGSLAWDQLCALAPGTPVFLRKPDRRGRKQVERGTILVPEYPDGVTINVVDPMRYKLSIMARDLFHKFEVRLTEHETSRRLSRAGSILARTVADFSSEWIHSPTTCCSVLTNVARWRGELASIEIGAARDRTSLGDFLAPSHVEDVSRVNVVSAKHAEDVRCDLAILDGPNALSHREQVRARRLVVLLTTLEYQRSGSELAALLAARDLNNPGSPVADPLFETAVFTVPVS